jgi:AraC-like DNA-binding protein
MTAQAAADACGLEQPLLFKEAGLEFSSWQSLNRISQNDLTALWKAAERLSGRLDIGLNVLKYFHFRTAGPLAFKMMAATTFRQSIVESLHQISVINQVWDFSLSEKNQMGVMKFWPSDPHIEVTHHSYDAFIAACTRIIRDCFTEETCKLAELWFAHPDFGLKEQYEERLGCTCVFDTESYAVCLRWDLLDLPLPSADPDLYDSLDVQLEQLARSIRSLAFDIERIIFNRIKTGKPFSRKDVSAQLGIGERTMLRRLKEESLTYKEVEESVCERVARQKLLLGENMDVLAGLLGYADANSLAKMLKRRTSAGIRELRNPSVSG